MANNPLWVNANQASQLALRTSSLKAMAQVCRGWEVSVSARDLLLRKACCIATLEVQTDRDTDVKAARTERHSCQFSFSCLQNPSVIMTRNPHTMKSVANIFNHQGKVFVFLFKMKKDKQYHLRYEFIISSSTLVSPQRSFRLSLNLEPPKWLSQCCRLNPWAVVLREWRLSK